MRLKELRKEKNITQKELAKMLGFEQTIVCMWELGTREPSNETLIKMANYFNCSVDYLLGREEMEQVKKQPEKVELQIEDNLSEAHQDCISLIMQLSEGQAYKLSGYIEKMLEDTKENKKYTN